jgi:hypothetical protein
MVVVRRLCCDRCRDARRVRILIRHIGGRAVPSGAITRADAARHRRGMRQRAEIVRAARPRGLPGDQGTGNRLVRAVGTGVGDDRGEVCRAASDHHARDVRPPRGAGRPDCGSGARQGVGAAHPAPAAGRSSAAGAGHSRIDPADRLPVWLHDSRVGGRSLRARRRAWLRTRLAERGAGRRDRAAADGRAQLRARQRPSTDHRRLRSSLTAHAATARAGSTFPHDEAPPAARIRRPSTEGVHESIGPR